MTDDAGNPYSAQPAALADALRAPAPRAPSADEVERALASVMARRATWTGNADLAPPTRLGPLAGGVGRWAAAAALLVAVLTPLWFRSHGSDDGNRDAAPRIANRAAGRVLLSTRVGQVDSVRLGDGTLVVLAPASRLETSDGAGASPRTVVLEGDGYFDVVHDSARPFTVLTPHAVVRDVGTAFGVRDAADGATVTVQRGEVDVTRRTGDATAVPRGARLRAGDRVVVPALGGGAALAVERGVASDADVAWTRGRLVLREAGVPEIVDAMRRWYGIDLRVAAGALASRRVTATFERESGADAARIIVAALGARSRALGDTVWIRPAAMP